MKKHTLILAAMLLLVGIATAQKLDRALLPGKWSAVGISLGDIFVSKDDMAGSKQTLIKMVEAQTPGYTYQDADSAIIQTALNTMFEELGKCTIIFEKNGDVKIRINMNGEQQNMDGKYKWVGDDKLFLDDTSSKNDDDTAVVTQLSKTRFAFALDEEQGKIEMIFERN